MQLQSASPGSWAKSKERLKDVLLEAAGPDRSGDVEAAFEAGPEEVKRLAGELGRGGMEDVEPGYFGGEPQVETTRFNLQLSEDELLRRRELTQRRSDYLEGLATRYAQRQNEQGAKIVRSGERVYRIDPGGNRIPIPSPEMHFDQGDWTGAQATTRALAQTAGSRVPLPDRLRAFGRASIEALVGQVPDVRATDAAVQVERFRAHLGGLAEAYGGAWIQDGAEFTIQNQAGQILRVDPSSSPGRLEAFMRAGRAASYPPVQTWSDPEELGAWIGARAEWLAGQGEDPSKDGTIKSFMPIYQKGLEIQRTEKAKARSAEIERQEDVVEILENRRKRLLADFGVMPDDPDVQSVSDQIDQAEQALLRLKGATAEIPVRQKAPEPGKEKKPGLWSRLKGKIATAPIPSAAYTTSARASAPDIYTTEPEQPAAQAVAKAPLDEADRESAKRMVEALGAEEAARRLRSTNQFTDEEIAELTGTKGS